MAVEVEEAVELKRVSEVPEVIALEEEDKEEAVTRWEAVVLVVEEEPAVEEEVVVLDTKLEDPEAVAFLVKELEVEEVLVVP